MVMPESPQLSPTTFDFKKNGAFLQGNADANITIDAKDSVTITTALRNDTTFPPGTLHLGTVTAKASVDSGDIEFDGGKGTVSFSKGGSANGRLGVYSDAADLIGDLTGNSSSLEGLNFGDPSIHRYAVLYWAYNSKASAKGSLALGFGSSAKFGVDASSDGLYAVV